MKPHGCRRLQQQAARLAVGIFGMGQIGRVWGGWRQRVLARLWRGARGALVGALVGAAGGVGAAEPTKAVAAVASTASNWPRLAPAEFAACGREMRLFRGYVQVLRDADVRAQCQAGGEDVVACDAAGLNCKKGNPCTDARREAEAEKAGSDVDWYLRGNSRCEGARYPCWGESVVNGNPVTDADRQAWLAGQTDNAAMPYELAKLKPAPARLEAGQDVSRDTFGPVEAAVRTCLAKPWLAKYRAQNAANASNPANPANAASAANAAPLTKAVGSAPPVAVEAPLLPSMTGPQCQAEIVKIHREARAAVQAVPNPPAVRAVNAEMARRQKLLFATRCAAQADAAEYVAAAERLLAAGAAQAAAPAPPAGLLGAGAPGGDMPAGAAVVTPAAPVNECLRALETGLYGGFVNKCGYKVNAAYCVSNPKKGGWTDNDVFRCLSPANTQPANTQHGNAYISLAASKTEVQHTLGGDAVLWLACKDPAVPWQTRFDGARMLGTCKDR